MRTLRAWLRTTATQCVASSDSPGFERGSQNLQLGVHVAWPCRFACNENENGDRVGARHGKGTAGPGAHGRAPAADDLRTNEVALALLFLGALAGKVQGVVGDEKGQRVRAAGQRCGAAAKLAQLKVCFPQQPRRLLRGRHGLVQLGHAQRGSCGCKHKQGPRAVSAMRCLATRPADSHGRPLFLTVFDVVCLVFGHSEAVRTVSRPDAERERRARGQSVRAQVGPSRWQRDGGPRGRRA